MIKDKLSQYGLENVFEEEQIEELQKLVDEINNALEENTEDRVLNMIAFMKELGDKGLL